ncbi:hypothetical protein HC928_06220 [bacterium]|nr:hypothetical protein [bacterium]
MDWITFQSFIVTGSNTLAPQMLGYAADVAADLIPVAMAFAGVMMGLRVYRSLKR